MSISFDSLSLLLDRDMYGDPAQAVSRMVTEAGLSAAERAQICTAAARLVEDVRGATSPGMMEVFLAEYGLSTDEGVALMCLAEALLRVPDADTIDALIEDKIAASDWSKHLGHSTSPLVNASTWALMLTGKVLDGDAPRPAQALRAAIRRVGEPVIRTAVARAMREMGRQFVLGETIGAAMKRAAGMEAKGYTYSYDMLGEAARTEADAARYHLSYSRAISAIAEACDAADIRQNPGISVKLSALFPRYEMSHRDQALSELVPRLRSLALLAKSANMGLNVDAEEADRLSLSLEVIERVLAEPALAGWDGFGVVVQAYGPRAGAVIDALYDMAERYDRRLMVRLVKGAYWDTEVKRAQVEGMAGFPVFTDKAATDVSYIANARKLLDRTDRIYPQFATHNAHTASAILHMAGDRPFEFQRLHGMGESLHDLVKTANGSRCRIYAPVGAHRDLLAYLVRRLLENGANSSFVNQIVDETIPAAQVVSDPFEAVEEIAARGGANIVQGPDLYQPERVNSKGFDLTHTPTLEAIEAARSPWRAHRWAAAPLIACADASGALDPVPNPADPADQVGTVRWATMADVDGALSVAQPWLDAGRGAVLNRVADLYEAEFGQLFALLSREAGKTLPDAVAELREAVDFLRYYGARAPEAAAGAVWTCISPWNFPLAIFTGQIAAALATGNAVLAKPAQQTPLVAHLAVSLMHRAGVPVEALQLLPGDGAVGAMLTSDARVGGVAFTGSTQTAHLIRRAMAENLEPGAPLIAETGGLNAMIVDSTALPEQAVQAIVESAFQSAGQRCSALRCLYVQEDIADDLLTMLKGAMDMLRLGDPWALDTDSGPVIDAAAQAGIQMHVTQARSEGRVLHEGAVPAAGTFVAPTLIEVSGISDLEREIFGPVLHVARFGSQDLDRVIRDINATGYGLTFGLQTRIDDRVQQVAEQIHAGNVYVNRNQIGAIVGSQPFGGEGLSGTGPKAGGPHYLARFAGTVAAASNPAAPLDAEMSQTLPGPTGESNQLTLHAREPLLCLGPREKLAAQIAAVERMGGKALPVEDAIYPSVLSTMEGISGALWWGDVETARAFGCALAERSGPILPLITGTPDLGHIWSERHICVDTTASGGNTALLSGNA